MTDQPDPDLREHEERAVAAFMTRLAALAPEGAGLALQPGALWWKCQLLRRWDAEAAVSRPLDVIESLEIAGGLIAAGLLLFWSLPSLAELMPAIPCLQ